MKEEEKKLQEKYVEMKMLEEHIKELQNQAEVVEQQLIEVVGTMQSLEEFGKANKGDEILVPINSGIFARAELKDNAEFLVNVGADTVVKKDAESTKRLIEKQAEEMQELHTKMHIQLQRFAMHASAVNKELKELASKAR